MECNAPRVLRLTIKRKWFDLIRAGEKREEYRDMKKFWLPRLQERGYDEVEFFNGPHFGRDLPRMRVECLGIIGNVALGRFEIRLGKVLEVVNV